MINGFHSVLKGVKGDKIFLRQNSHVRLRTLYSVARFTAEQNIRVIIEFLIEGCAARRSLSCHCLRTPI